MTPEQSRAVFGRRQILRGAAILSAGAAAAACAGPGTVRGGSRGPASQATAPAPIGTAKVSGDLSFAHWRAEDKAVFDKIIAGFSKANPGTTVRQDISPSNDYQSTALQKIKGGAIGDAFTAFRGAQFVDMAKAGLFLDLSAQTFADGYLPKMARGGKDANGRQLGLPYQLVFNMPIFNVDLFERAGASEIPQDWDGFLALCEQLKGRGVVPLAWPGGEPANAGQLFNSMVMNNQPNDTSCADIEAGKAKVTDDWFITTLKQYAQLRPFVEPKATGTTSEPLQQMFATGKAAMLATGSFHMAPVRKLGAKFPIDLIAPITVSKDKVKYVGIHNATFILGVNAASKKQEAALKFVEYLSRPEVASDYANGTGQHLTLTGVEYTSPDLKATEPWLTRNTLLAPRFQFNDLDLRAAVENACTEVLGGKDPEQAAEAAQRVVDQRRRS
ncbi:ABC transporter substrate-binding protein [Knoellia sp. p5-6-4]|uniref:ABC transporter substrate-binding protein n=1 Tax=unclassified Knoellia TaxID=2618719 RepID=UPI0023D9933A|nr:extracellular solute-binding protein [Knoellia sp. p5-6-4]MDF2145032.1 extracellular solute-binding protein [Knoellia sp. p5-6-4]